LVAFEEEMEAIVTVSDRPKIRHPQKISQLRQALDGETQAANKVLILLGSINPSLSRIMEEAIHDLDEPRLWPKLLHSLAYQRWNSHVDCERRTDSKASERIDQSIAKVFTQDVTEVEKRAKEATLLEALNSPEYQLRQAAAYLLGLRGDPRALPVLETVIECGTTTWILRAVNALATLNDERCGHALLQALAMGHTEIHHAARRALKKMGALAKSTWLDALDYPDDHMRWHAIRGLGEIGDVDVAVVLADGLRAESRLVRWATADALARIGKAAVPATLTMLSRHKLNSQFRDAAYHALHGIASTHTRERLQPLLDALHGPAPDIEAPAVAQRLLMGWEATN
jgi:HEAT repeat protein